jgi:hypothetical protein
VKAARSVSGQLVPLFAMLEDRKAPGFDSSRWRWTSMMGGPDKELLIKTSILDINSVHSERRAAE